MNRYLVYFIVIFFAFIMLSSTIMAFAQIPTQQMVQRLEAEGKPNCEISQFNEFFYKPIRINMVHDRVIDHSVSIQSKDPESVVHWEGSFQTFQLVTDSPDRFDVEIILDYEEKHEEPRQVWYQIYGLDNVLMAEGNYVHEGFTFCKVFSFTTTDPPHILTSEEIQAENNAFNSDFRKEVALSNTSVQNALLLIGIVTLVVGTVVGLIFFVIIVSLRSMGKIGNKPVKKLNDMIENVRTTNDNLKLVADHLIATDTRAKDEITSELRKSMADASIVMYGAKKIIEDLAKVVGTKIVLNPSPNVIKTVQTKKVKTKTPKIEEPVVQPNTPEEELANEEDTERRLLGGKTQKEINVENGVEEPKPEHEIIEMDDDDIKPCKICGEPPTAICGTCNEQFCNNHLNHGCDLKELKPKEESLITKENVYKASKKIKTVFMEDKDPSITEEGEVQKYLDKGMSELKITRMLINEYSKTGRNENLRVYGDLQKKQTKKNTRELDIKIGAMLNTLNNQVN